MSRGGLMQTHQLFDRTDLFNRRRTHALTLFAYSTGPCVGYSGTHANL